MTFASPQGGLRARGAVADQAPSGADSIPDDDSLRALLRQSFGKEDFRPGQLEIIRAVLAGEDVLGLLPTGGGKSLCYQLPALLLPGTVVVVSPLIALMQDQLDNLPADLAGRATVINSRLTPAEIEERLQRIAAGELRLVFVAPERLPQWPFLHALRRAGLSLLVVDEAHCISLWGHDFRPDYFFISTALECLGRPQVLALTATATPQVQDEIDVRLGRRLRRVRAGVARPNLRLEVRWASSDTEKQRHLWELVHAAKGPAIVYARSRDKCEELARWLHERGIRAIAYHAGLADSRESAQRAFMQGQARVVCATEAFGMGIDKADVRLIVHCNLRASVEDYWQEAGRAGRDGQPARCVLLVGDDDLGFLEWSVRQEAISLSLLQEVYRALQRLLKTNGPGRVAMEELERESGQQAASIRVALSLLEQCGWVRRYPDLPRSLWMRPTGGGDDAFATFIGNAGLTPGMPVTLDPLGLCATTGVEPQALEAQLLVWRDARWLQVGARGGRDLLLALLPPKQNARVHPRDLVEDYQARREERTQAMAAYAGLRHHCRHAFIAQSFGTDAPESCKACDNCLSRTASSPAPARLVEGKARLGPNGDRPPTRHGNSARKRDLAAGSAGKSPESAAPIAPAERAAATRAVLLTLVSAQSPVVREELVRALRGAEHAPARLKECATFGALAQWPQRRVETLVSQAAEAGLIRLRVGDSGGEYAYHLTDRGREALASGVMPERAGIAPIRSASPEPRGHGAPRSAHTLISGPVLEGMLYHRLRTWRNETARENGVEAYRVLNNDTLLWLSQMRPRTLADLRDVPGIGEVKAGRYGEAILEILQKARG